MDDRPVIKCFCTWTLKDLENSSAIFYQLTDENEVQVESVWVENMKETYQFWQLWICSLEYYTFQE